MSDHDLILVSREVVLPEGVRPAAVVIEDGVIARIVPSERAGTARGIVDVGDAVLLPGLVDSHVHINEPGRSEWEGFETATMAAAAGGITTVVDMPLNSSPVTTTVEALAAKAAAARGACVVDYGFWGGVVPGNTDQLGPLLDAGVLGFKCFMAPSGIDEFPPVSADDLQAALPVLAARGGLLLAHAEDPAVLDEAAVDGRLAEMPRRYDAYLASRPPAAERRAIQDLIRLCREHRSPVHVVHLSAAEALPDIAAARNEGLPLTVETCPHYLVLSAEEIPDGATLFKCAPPIRGRDNRRRLWAALSQGLIDLIVSDHSPCPPALKGLDQGDFAGAWGGIASLQLGLPAVWTAAAERGHGLQDVARWMSAAPARLAGLEGRKGRIAIGADADLVVFEPDRSFTVEAPMLHHRHPLTPYTGMTLRGKVRRTYLRGGVVYDDGEFSAGRRGRRVTRHSDERLHAAD